MKAGAELTKGPDKVKFQWYFMKTLIISSDEDMPSLSICWDLEDRPKAEELETTLGKLKKGKAG